jgi:gliding motility-associated-like protein
LSYPVILVRPNLFFKFCPTLQGAKTGWDGTYKGKPMPPGVYVFVIKATYVNEFQSKLHKGSFLLLR